MSDKLNPALDPAYYLGMSAGLSAGISGVEEANQLLQQSDILLAHCQAGDYSVMIRHHNSLALAAQLAAHSSLQKAMQCEDPAEQAKWLASAAKSQAMAERATEQVVSLTNTAEKLRPYHAKILATATRQAQALVDQDAVKREALMMFRKHKADFEEQILESNLGAEAYVHDFFGDMVLPKKLVTQIK